MGTVCILKGGWLSKRYACFSVFHCVFLFRSFLSFGRSSFSLFGSWRNSKQHASTVVVSPFFVAL
jgi:hypothetical protein